MREIAFQFQRGDTVALKENHTVFLPHGSRGTIRCQHEMAPPAYEVNFRDISGDVFGAVLYEDEIEPVRVQGPA